jgi:hypothetical protein
LSAVGDKTNVYMRSFAFLQALFEETALVLLNDKTAVPKPDKLEPIKHDGDMQSLAKQFRSYMVDGMSMQSHGRFRNEFYKRVAESARRVSFFIASYRNRTLTVYRRYPVAMHT